jgi:hypothetical protein
MIAVQRYGEKHQNAIFTRSLSWNINIKLEGTEEKNEEKNDDFTNNKTILISCEPTRERAV